MPRGIYVRTAKARANARLGTLRRYEDLAERAKSHQRMMGNQYALGYRHTEETKQRIGRKGERHHMYGRHHSETSKELMSQATKMRMSNPENHGMFGKKQTEEARAKIGKANKGNQYLLGYRHSEEKKAEMGLAQMGHITSEEARSKIGRAQKVLWRDPEYRDRAQKAMRVGRLIHPNKPEVLLLELLESVYPGEWKFVGDGQFILAGKNPDFVNINGKKQIAELFGNWWHRGEDPQERIDLFRQFGYSALIIWENELKEPEKVLEKIARMEG